MSTDIAGREPLILVEIDYDFCELEYGSSPCTAALDVSGVRKCYNTRQTCQDPNNYQRGTITLTFVEPHVNQPRDVNWIPLLDSVSTNPTRINVGGGDRDSGPLGTRASVRVRFRDAPHPDIQVDKYRAERITGIANEGSLGDEGTEPDTVPDASGNNNDGTNNGATVAVVEGRSGLEFDLESENRVKLLTDSSGDVLDIVEDVTLEAWFNANSFPNFSYIVSRNDTGGGVNQQYALALNNSDIYTARGGITETISYDFQINIWYFLSVVYDSQNETATAYVNGEEVDTKNTPEESMSRQNMNLGARSTNTVNTGATFEFDGIISDVRIWNYARTQAEIQADMHKRLTGNEPGLVGYWPMRGKPFDPLDRGTFWSKFRTRNPFYRNRRLRIREGYVGQALEEMRTRHYFFDTLEGPDANERVSVKGKDVLKFLDDDRAQWPERSPGVLVNDVSEAGSELRISGAEVTDYDPKMQGSGTVRVGDEIIRWSTMTVDGDDIILSDLTRGSDRSEVDDHEEDDNVQRCQRYEDEPLRPILDDIMAAGKVPAEFIPSAAWDMEIERWLADARATVLLSEPFGANELLSELTEQFTFYLWWDELDQLINLRAIRPLDPVNDEAPINIDDERNVIAGSFRIEDRPKDRRSQIWTYFRQIDPTENIDERDNYRRVRVRVDGNAESEEEYDESRRREVYARWIRSNTDAAILNTRLLNRYRDTPRFVHVQMDAKDRDVKTGAVVDLSVRQLQDDTGAQTAQRYQIISVEEVDPSHAQKYTAQQFEFVDRFGFFMSNDAPDYIDATMAERDTGAFWADGNTLQFADGTGPYRWI